MTRESSRPTVPHPTFPHLAPELVAQRLAPPKGRVRVVVDTDAANEIDDQFALTHALLSPDRLTIEAVTAAPFSFAYLQPDLIRTRDIAAAGGPVSPDDHALARQFGGWVARMAAENVSPEELDFVGPQEGMEESLAEIGRVFATLGIDPGGRVHQGAGAFLTSLDAPQDTSAAREIIRLARASPPDDPLYVACLGCVTNLASALIIAPDIAGSIVAVWTAGFPTAIRTPNRWALNLVEDPIAARLLFDCGVPLVYLPGFQIGAQLRLSLPEIETFVADKGAIGGYLADLFRNNPLHAQRFVRDTAHRTSVIWDIIATAWLVDPALVPTTVHEAAALGDDLAWRLVDTPWGALGDKAAGRHVLREAEAVDRDAIFKDFYDKLAGHARRLPAN